MANHLMIYTVIHQPRRPKLPAQPIPRGATPEDVARCIFDEPMNYRYFKKVASRCYWPTTELFHRLADEGMKFNIGFSLSFLEQAEKWDPQLLETMKKLIRHENVELIAVEPYHSFLFYVDMPAFVERMRWVGSELARIFGQKHRPAVTDTTEMFMSNDIYYALKKAGYKGAMMDGRPFVMEWREPGHVYTYDGTPLLFPRHYELSDDIGYRFSNRRWEGWPLLHSTYADWISWAPGEVVSLGWDFETFGEHHDVSTGIFDFMRALPEAFRQRNIQCVTASEAIELFGDRTHHLPLPQFPTTWAGEGGVEFFLGNSVQQAVFQLMHHAYNKALLTADPQWIDLAMWLLQSDNLHLIQWFGRYGNEAEVSAYFTPNEWWKLGPIGIVQELQQVYKNFVVALDEPAGRAKDMPSRRSLEIASTMPPLHSSFASTHASSDA